VERSLGSTLCVDHRPRRKRRGPFRPAL